jgi:hypothetical protein
MLQGNRLVHDYRAAVPIALALCIACTLLSATSEDAEAEQDDAILIWNQERFDHKVAEGRRPVTYNMSVKVASEKEMVTALYQVEGPKGWTNIFYSGDTEWDVGIWPEFWYIPGREYRLYITITPPYGALNASYWFVLRVHLEENESATDSVEFGLIMRQYADFELVGQPGYPEDIEPPPDGEFSVRPGDHLVNGLLLYNLGNGYDEFKINGYFSRPNRGWTVEFLEGVSRDGTTPYLPPDPFKKWPYYIEFKVSVPEGERAGITNPVYFNAVSRFNSSLERPSVYFSFTSLQVFGFEVHVKGKDAWESPPTEEAIFELQVNNTGNGWDTFTIKPIWDIEQNPGFVAAAEPRYLDIAAWSGKDVKYTVRVPRYAPKGAYFFYAEVRSSSSELQSVTKTLAVQVGQLYAFEMRAMGPQRLETIPGGNLEVELVVHNTGNGLDNLVIGDVIDAPSGWLTYVQPPQVSLFQDQEARVKVVIIVPSQRERARIGEYRLTVHALSTRSDATADLPIVVEVVQFFNVEWSNETLRPRREFNPYEKDTISYTLELKNYGNGIDKVGLDGHSSNPLVNLTFGIRNIVLGPEEVQLIKVTIKVEEGIAPGIFEVLVNATSNGPASVPRTLVLEFEVFTVDAMIPPIPTYVDRYSPLRIQARADQGDNCSFKLKVENNGTRPLDGVEVKVFEVFWLNGREVRWNFFNFTTPTIAVGDRYIVGERPFNADNPPLHWLAKEPGNHTFRFQIYYPHQSNTDNDVALLNLTVFEVPEHEVDDGFRLPDIRWTVIGILVIVMVSVTAFGVHQWMKELKQPMRPW